MDGQLLMRGFTLSPGSGQICPITVLPIPHFAILNLLPFQILPCPYFILSNALLCPNLISLHSAMSILHTLREHPAKKNPLFWHCPSNLSNYSTMNGPRRLCLFTRSQGRVVIKLARTKSIILLAGFILSIPLFALTPLTQWVSASASACYL